MSRQENGVSFADVAVAVKELERVANVRVECSIVWQDRGFSGSEGALLAFSAYPLDAGAGRGPLVRVQDFYPRRQHRTFAGMALQLVHTLYSRIESTRAKRAAQRPLPFE